MGYSIFLSHSHHDSVLAQRIKAQVETLGDVSVYLSEEHAEPGRHVYEKLQRAIEGHDAFAALITPNSTPSPYVNQEIGYALALNKLALPLVVPEANTKALAMLEGREYILLDPSDALPGMTLLLDFVRRQRDELRASAAAVEPAFGYVTPAVDLHPVKVPQDDLVAALLLLGVAVLIIYASTQSTK